MHDRRLETRQSVDLLFNKYIDGYPYLCRSIDLSEKGMRLLAVSEPEGTTDTCTLEMQLPDETETLWLWARTIRRDGRTQVVAFEGVEDHDRERLQRFLMRRPAN